MIDLKQILHRDPIGDRGVSVVMPVHNRAPTLEAMVARVVTTLEQLGRGHEIIIVDDGSTDATCELVTRLAAANARISLIRQPARWGYGAALRAGFQAAKYRLVLELDGDHECEVSDIGQFFTAIDEVDVVCGFRERRPSLFGSRLCDWLYRLMLRVVFAVRVRDVECRVRLYRRAALKRIPIQSNGRFAAAEILAKATFMNMLIGELPVRCRAAAGGETGPRESFRSTLGEATRVFRRPQFRLDAARVHPEDCAPQAA